MDELLPTSRQDQWVVREAFTLEQTDPVAANVQSVRMDARVFIGRVLGKMIATNCIASC